MAHITRFEPGDVIRHKKGGLYTFLHHALDEATLNEVCVYQCCVSNVIYVRPLLEMHDGRFCLWVKNNGDR